MAWTRASSLDRVLQCLGSAWIQNNHPEIKLVERSSGLVSAAGWGTLAHHWMATGEILEDTSKEGISREKTFRKKLDYLSKQGVTREILWPTSGWYEVSVAFNCVDRRVAVSWEGDPSSWKECYSSDWITGTADYISTADGFLVVDDLKTGATFDKSPSELAQTLFYLMCFEKIFHTRKDCVSSITHWTKYPVENVPNRSISSFSMEDLSRFEEVLINLYKEYRSEGKSRFVVGDECNFCDVKKANMCPLQGKTNEDNS